MSDLIMGFLIGWAAHRLADAPNGRLTSPATRVAK
jgi:hypothetical protein